MGYSAHYVEAASADDEGDAPKKPDTGFCLKSWNDFLEAEANRPKDGGCCLS